VKTKVYNLDIGIGHVGFWYQNLQYCQ